MSDKALTSELIKMKDVRLSFPRLWKAKAFQEGQEPRFEASFLLDPSKEAHKASIDEVEEAGKKLAIAKWGSVPEDIKYSYGYADKNPTKKKYDGYPGMFYIASANTTKPNIFGPNKTNNVWVGLNEGDKFAPYGGCYVNTNITLWTQSNKFGKAIRVNLRIVQFSKNGQAFSGAAPANPDDEIEGVGDAPGAKQGSSEDFE